MKQSKNYKETYSLEERRKKVTEQIQKYPDMIPIIVEKAKRCKLIELQRIKYLVNAGFSFNEFRNSIKKKLNLDEKTSTLFLYTGQVLLNQEQTLKEIYDKYKDQEDGFLYLSYSDSEVFG